jgi:hypothetical protein
MNDRARHSEIVTVSFVASKVPMPYARAFGLRSATNATPPFSLQSGIDAPVIVRFLAP